MTADNYTIVIQENISILEKYTKIFRSRAMILQPTLKRLRKSVCVGKCKHVWVCTHTKEILAHFIIPTDENKKYIVMLHL